MPDTSKMLRKDNPNWRGGRITCYPQGRRPYVIISMPNHPRANKKTGYVLEHIVNWEQGNSKSLPNGWVVHHLNGIGTDNRSTNLEALPNRRHSNVLRVKAKRIQQLEALLTSQGQLC